MGQILSVKGRSNMDMETINREANKQSTGFRYQKQRAVLHILDSLKISNEFFFAIEYLDDIYGEIYTEKNKIEILEQDKYYDEETTSTFSSKEIYISIINFLENWLGHKRSKVTTYLFVATNKIGKEQTTKATEALNIKLPDLPILKLLKERKYRNDEDLLNSIKTMLIYRYESVYSNKDNKAYLPEINKLTNQDWIDFLDRIEYLFEQEDTNEIKKQALEKIKSCNCFEEIRHRNKEEYIYSRIIDLLDERQSKDYPANFITYSDVKNVFLELAQQQQTKPDDPYWETWEEIEIEDTRGLEEKIIAVNSNFDAKRLKRLKRRVSNAYNEETKAIQNTFLAQKCRIFENCSEVLLEKFNLPSQSSLTEEQIVSILNELYTASENALNEASKTYHCPYNNKETIKGTILNLFNECYLAFDEAEEVST
jgi:Icc-related predicted phosphoesterase